MTNRMLGDDYPIAFGSAYAYTWADIDPETIIEDG